MPLKTESLASMCEAVVDCPHSTPVWTDSGFVVLRNQNIKDGRLDLSAPSYTDEEHFKQRVRRMAPRPGDIVITREAPMGEVCKIPDGLTCCLGQRQVLLRPKAGINADYLLYALQSPVVQEQIRWNEGTGSTVSNIRIPVLEKIEIPRLGASEQFIAAALKSVDDKIDLNRRINQTLEAMAQAIFQSWFVDFDPVKAKIAAKAEGRDPLRAAMSAISGKADAELEALPLEQYEQLAATAALFPNAMEASNLGQIPKGWAINQISQFGDVVCGKTPSKTNPHFFGEGIPFIKIPDMHNNVYVVSPLEQLSASGAASQVKKTIPPGSICVSCIATVGKVVIAHEPSQTNQQINSIVPRHPQYTTYLYFQMRAKDKEFHDLASGGSATLNMNTSTFSKVSVLNPAFNVLEKFSVNVEPLFSEILVRQKQSALLSEARDTLLPKLLSGELSVADAMVEAVA